MGEDREAERTWGVAGAAMKDKTERQLLDLIKGGLFPADEPGADSPQWSWAFEELGDANQQAVQVATAALIELRKRSAEHENGEKPQVASRYLS